MRQNRPAPKDKYAGIIRNNQIKCKEVRVDGEVIPTRQALYEARDQELDLIMVNEKANPPVCRIVDLNKFIYEQKQREKTAKKKQRENAVEQKEIRMSLNIDVGDIEVKCNTVRKMLEKNCKVTLTVSLKGRERQRPELARDLLQTFAQQLDVELEEFSQAGNKVSARIA